MSAAGSGRGPLWQRLGPGASAGYDLVANVLVGLGLGWLLQRFFPGLKPWGYAGGILLGALSGFYQLFRSQSRRSSGKGGDGPDGPSA